MEYDADCLFAQQQTHPPTDGFPFAAQIDGLPLYIGNATAAQDESFLQTIGITAVIALGTGRVTPEPISVLAVDILDLDDQLILVHFEKCIQFLRTAISDLKSGKVLVHCVYGQSRSASVCIAYLMAEKQMSLVDAYNCVRDARPCIYVNHGFLKQLKLFEQTKCDFCFVGDSNAHAQIRALIAARQRIDTGIVHLYNISLPTGDGYYCGKCRFQLCTPKNIIHVVNTAQTSCVGVFIEPMKWMNNPQGINKEDFGYEKEGKLFCPKCKTKVGTWSWTGVKCSCKVFVTPAFQLTKSRLRLISSHDNSRIATTSIPS